MLESWHCDPSIAAFLLKQKGEIIAYGELWIEEEEVELARLLVKPQLRGLGFGKTLLSKLRKRAELLQRKIWLRVHPENQRAKALYLQNGFATAPSELQAKFNQQQLISFIWMEALLYEFGSCRST